MPVTAVVGHYGPEGKGKVAHHQPRHMRASIAVRVGGPNSGHTAYCRAPDLDGGRARKGLLRTTKAA